MTEVRSIAECSRIRSGEQGSWKEWNLAPTGEQTAVHPSIGR